MTTYPLCTITVTITFMEKYIRRKIILFNCLIATTYRCPEMFMRIASISKGDTINICITVLNVENGTATSQRLKPSGEPN